MLPEEELVDLEKSLNLPKEYSDYIRKIAATILSEKPEINLEDICKNYFKLIFQGIKIFIYFKFY